MALPTLISAAQLKAVLSQSDLVVLDCRFYLNDLSKGQQEFHKGHIPGAVFVDLHHDLAGAETETSGRHPLPDAKALSASIQQWGIEPSSQVVVYDDMGGAFAARAWWMLVQQGIEVMVLDGGFPAWVNAGYDVTSVKTTTTPAKYPVDVQFPWFISEEHVVTNFESGQFQLIDARAQDRFQGLNETMDPVAGHIPGALNRPFADNLQPSGQMKSPDVLFDEWSALLGEVDVPVVYYCGSGVTACHNVLAMNHAGLEAKHVYVGSWSQWAKRIQRQLALSDA